MNTRAEALQVLYSVIRQQNSLTAVLDEIESSKDKAFIQAICFGVLRYYERLNFILNQLAKKPIRDESVRLLAMIGLFQLEYMRVKPYAAVSETVDALGGKVWAKSLINAVLRNYQRERAELLALADKDEQALWAHPAWLIGKTRKDWPDDFERILQQNNIQPPLALRVNRLKCNRDDYLQRLAELDIPAKASELCDQAIILDKPVALDVLPGFSEGFVSVQDVAAQLAAGLMDLKPGQRVLDVCAAPGGKTLHMLETCPDISEMIALDVSAQRVQRIYKNLERSGLKAQVMVQDAANPSAWWDGKPYDRILLDAPCSATGVIRRHPDIKVLRRPDDFAGLQALQSRILEAVWPLLAEGGMLVYATCSIFKQENDGQISEFLKRHPEAKEIEIDAAWGRAKVHGRQILTGDSGMDGFYYARLCK